MKSSLINVFKKKKFLKFLAIGVGFSLTATTIILPTTYYATAQNLLYIDSLGNVKESRTTTTQRNEYVGDFTPGNSYKTGDIVSVKEARFYNPDLLSQFERTNNQVMYRFNQDWSGTDFSTAPVTKYIPNNLTTVSIPLSQFILDSKKIDSFMGNSLSIYGIGKASVTGKFTGSGAAYWPEAKPGYVSIDKENFLVNLSNLDEYFTWTKNEGSVIEQAPPVVGAQPTYANPSPTLNAYPEIGDSEEEKKRDRYGFDRAGMYAIQVSNNIDQGSNQLNIVDSWYSDINSSNYTQFADMDLGDVSSFYPTFVRLSNDKNKTFYLDDDNLGVYIYSKSSNYPLASRYATINFITNSLYSGFYQGVGEPIYSEKSPDQYEYLTKGPRQDIVTTSVSFPGTNGQPQKREFQVGLQALHGAYVYSKSTTWPDPSDSFLLGITKFDSEPFNPDRDISYINGIFSINKPAQFLEGNEKQDLKWYVPIASTDFSVHINQQKVEEYKEKFLATDAMNLAYVADMYEPYMYNAIPSTFYGAEMTVTADNTNGTIWINVKSGPTVEVTNGALMDEQQTPGRFVDKPSWLLGMNWTYFRDTAGTYSRYWYLNQNNPVSEVLMGEPIDYTVAITGFQKILPTKIVHTTNLKGEEFIPGVSEANETEYGPYRLTGVAYANKTPFDYIKEEEAKPEGEQYLDLMQIIYDELVYNKGPTFNNEATGKPFISFEDLLKVSDVTAYNFIDQNHPEWGGRIQFSVSLTSYFSEEGLYIQSGGYPSVPVMFSGFKAVPGPTTINANYNLNSMIPGGAIEFNRQSLGTQNGVNYPSDYLDPDTVPAGSTVNKRLEDILSRWSRKDPFLGDGSTDKNEAFTSDSFMIKNLPDDLDDGTKPFTINDGDVEFNNFSGVLKITPKFQRYYNLEGNLVTGVNTSLGTITISGFQTVDGSTYIPPVVQAISSDLQPSAIVTGSKNVDPAGNYIGQELYKIVWNETINLPTKNYELPPYGTNDLTTEQLEEIRKVVDIKIKPDDKEWINNKDGFLKFAVAFKRIFDVNGIPTQIPSKDLWPEGWEVDKPNDHIFIVTVYGYNSSPGPTGILQQLNEAGEPVNRDIVVNQPNFQPSEFIKNDAAAGYPLLRSLIQGNLVNIPNNFNSQDIVLSVDDFNADNSIAWDPVSEGKPLPLVPNNLDGSIQVQVYLKNWYNLDSKLCNFKEDNKGLPYTSVGEINEGPAWSFKISGFMKTTAKGESDLGINDTDFSKFSSPNTIDLSNPEVYALISQKYPTIAKLKEMLPYQFASPTSLLELLLIKNDSQSSKTQPYLLMKNIPDNIKPYNMIIKKENIVVNNIDGSISFKLTLKQWYTIDPATKQAVYHPTIEDQSNGILEFTTKNAITISGLKKVKNATIIKPVGDTVKNNGEIVINKASTSEQIINGILLEKWLNENPDNVNNLPAYKPFIASENQPIVLDDTDLKVYIYVALFESGGSPYTLEKGSIVEKTEHGSYHINDLVALNEFITWKIDPYYDLESGTVEMYPMLNVWFGGDNAQIFNQYQSFGAGDSGKPQVGVNDVIIPASITTVKLSGFIPANASLAFNDAYVFNNQAIIQYLDSGNESISLSKFTANDFAKNPLFIESVKNIITTQGAIVSIVNQPGDTDFSINNIIDFNDPNWYKVNELNGTIEIKTKELKYFDGNKELKVGSISLIISGFKPSVSAYLTTYIILIITIVALIVILAIVLSRILWVKYNKSRNNYEK